MSMRPQHLYEFGPYRLDTAEQLLLRDGKPVPLTPKAFETLVALVERSGHLVEKEELMKLVWADAFVEESNLTNNVAAIRKLLGQGKSGQSYIETVPKRGYRFTAPVKELPPGTLVVEKRTLTRVVTQEAVDDDAPRQTLIGAGEALERAPVHTTQRSQWRWPLVALFGSFLVIAGIFIYRSLTASHALTAAPRAPIESIAVLPFKNESGNPDVEYLSDGVTESLINSLSQLPQLKVIARNSSFQYKDKDVNAQDVSRALGVHAILLGHVVQRDDNLVVSVELMDARDKTQVWGERYTRKATDVQALQEDIARTIAEKLRLKLSGAQEQQLTKRATQNPQAYQLYLKGRYHVRKQTPAEAQKGIAYFQQAIDFDPSYALAYTGLAAAYRVLTLTGGLLSEQMLRAKAVAEKAVEIDDNLGEAHAELGFAIFWYDWDWSESEKHFRRALELEPNNAPAYLGYAHLNSNLGRHDQAIALAQRAVELDPLWLMANSLYGQFLFYAGRYDEAIAQARRTLELEPGFWHPHLILAYTYVEKGMYDEAVAEGSKARELSDGNTSAIRTIGCALARAGKREEARAILAQLKKLSTERYVSPYHIAMVYAALGEREEAIDLLEQAYQHRDAPMVFLKIDQRWNNLRGDPRFQDLLRRVGLTQ